MYYISQLIFQRAKVLQIMKTAKHFAIKMQKRRRISAVSVFLFKFRKYFFYHEFHELNEFSMQDVMMHLRCNEFVLYGWDDDR